MPWTSPATFIPGQIIAAADLNSQLRDNELYLLAGRPVGYVVRQGSADYVTSSTSFVDVDAANAILTLTLNGSRALVIATGTMEAPVGQDMYFDWIVDSTTRAGGSSGVSQSNNNNQRQQFTAIGFFNGLSAGVHTFKLQYRSASGAATLHNNGQPLTLFGVEI